MKSFLIAILLCGSAASMAAEPFFPRVLVVIGYTDLHDDFAEQEGFAKKMGALTQKIGIGNYDYLPGLATETAEQLAVTLEQNGLRSASNGVIQTWTSADGIKEVTVVNANHICQGEDPTAEKVERRYSGECAEQRSASYVASRFVRENLMKYDAVIYVGHSRYGTGFGLGNFNDESSKIPLQPFVLGYQNPANRLKFLMVSSCGSYRQYRNAMGSRIKFLGLQNEDAVWLEHIVPATQDILTRLLREPDLIQRFAQKTAYD